MIRRIDSIERLSWYAKVRKFVGFASFVEKLKCGCTSGVIGVVEYIKRELIVQNKSLPNELKVVLGLN